VDGWRRQEIGISEGGSLRRPRPTQGCSAEKKKKKISVHERLALKLRFLASVDSYVSLQYLFKISKQAISCIVPEVCEALVEKLMDYVQVRQTLLRICGLIKKIKIRL
jgi:hypothetical protein